MNKLLNAEHITNENGVPEQKPTDIIPEEGINVSVENELETAVIEDNTPKLEELAEDTIPESETELLIDPDEELPDPDEETTEFLPEEEISGIEKLNKTEIVGQLAVAVEEPLSEVLKSKIDALKQTFYKLLRNETEEAKRNFVQAGNPENAFVPEIDPLEEKVKELLAVFREKKAFLIAEAEKIKEENLATKKAIIEKLKTLIDSQDDFYKVYNEFRKLQQQWKEIKQIPQTAANDLWKEYQHYSEKFYDLLKINNEMRDYDFKKNLELKQALCESVERLDHEKDVVSAFYQLQKLHQEWREIGPVSKEQREEIWSRFKKASSIIHKRHQDHFESLRALEQRNLREKMALCEEIESIDYSKLHSFKEWDNQYKRVIDAQEKWKAIGFAPKKNNVKVFERFRTACDIFFSKKSEHYKSVRNLMDVNMEKQRTLCEKAEALKDSQDWKDATNQLVALQKEWKSSGPVPRKHSEMLWKRFISACDYFFEQKNSHFSSQKTSESENLKKKKAVVAKIKALEETLSGSEAVARIREMMAEYNSIGHVPFRDKDKIHKEYRAAVDKHFDRLKVDESERRLKSFRTNVNEMAEGKSKNKLLNEREKLMRTYERLKGDIQTYENNIGFLSVSSKGGGGLLKEMNRKIETLKEELELIVRKIEVIDNSLGFEK